MHSVLHSGLHIEIGLFHMRLDCFGLDAKALKTGKALRILILLNIHKAFFWHARKGSNLQPSD